MNILKIAKVIALILLLTGCANPGRLIEPMITKGEKLDLTPLIPQEAGLLIPEPAKNQIFRSPDYPDYHGAAPVYILEPYHLAIGKTFEKAALDIFSQVFQKVQIIRTTEEAKNYRLVIEPKLSDLRLHIFYRVLGRREYGVLVFVEAQTQVSGHLFHQGQPAWQKTIESPKEKRTWVFNYSLLDEVGGLAAETMVLALKDLALCVWQEYMVPPKQSNTPGG
jgi:hypothetical protein